VEHEQIDEQLVAVDVLPVLAADEREPVTELQQELLDMGHERGLEHGPRPPELDRLPGVPCAHIVIVQAIDPHAVVAPRDLPHNLWGRSRSGHPAASRRM
jgi:hypothetical protein